VNDKEHSARTIAVGMDRKLTAILAADVKGYSRLMGEDEVATLRTLTAYRKIIDTLLEQHRGRIVGTAGDSILAEFASVVDAVQCAVVIQTTLRTENTPLPPDRKMEFRIGVNLGDVMAEGEQIYGDGVNIAARLEALAEGGGICISGSVHEQIENKLSLHYEDLGEQTVKNIKKPVRVYRVMLEGPSSPVGQASSLLTARMAVPPEGSSKFQVPGSTLKEESPQPRRVSIAHRTWVVAGGLALIVGAIVTVRYFLFPTLSTQDSALSTDAASAALPLPDKPSIVVLPFTNISGDPAQEYFSDGITEDITADLSKISSFFVIARHSAFTYKGKAIKVQEISRELGVRYVLEGSVRKAGERVRVTAQLIDATRGYHLWTERYDRPLRDLFAVQDEIRRQIIMMLRVEVREAELERIQRIPTENLTAYDYWLRGQESFLRLTKEANAQARQMYEKALELDPMFAQAYASLGAAYQREWLLLQLNGSLQTLERAFELAQKAVELDNSLPGAYRTLGWVYLWKKQHEQAIVELERALALDPNSADDHLVLGTILAWAGRPEDAIGMIEKAMRLNPFYHVGYANNLGFAYILAGRYEVATSLLQQAINRNPNFLDAHVNLVVCHVELGREEEARAEVTEILRLSPQFSVEGLKQISPYKDPAVGEHYLAALRKAGLK
jgi:TolB-like protein/class 3 adenylate cyclase/Tfp pilus assembly protein PilF